jgi:hypothetical protein
MEGNSSEVEKKKIAQTGVALKWLAQIFGECDGVPLHGD